MLVCATILLLEPIVRGIIKERLEAKEIWEFWKDGYCEWWEYLKEKMLW